MWCKKWCNGNRRPVALRVRRHEPLQLVEPVEDDVESRARLQVGIDHHEVAVETDIEDVRSRVSERANRPWVSNSRRQQCPGTRLTGQSVRTHTSGHMSLPVW